MKTNRFFRALWIGGTCLAGSACAADNTSPGPVEDPGPPEAPHVAGVILLGNGQAAVVGEPLAQAIGVKLIDQYGAPMSGIMVRFALGAGGGSLSTDSASTDAHGDALTNWTLGVSAAVDYRVTATVTGYSASIPPLRAAGRAGPPFKVEVVSGDTQTGMIGTDLPVPLVVRVADAFDNPVRGVVVRWAVGVEGGWTSADSTVTGWTGTSSIVRTLGPALGETRTLARLADSTLPAVSFAATAVPLVSQYDIDVRFTSPIPPALAAAINAAAARWSRIIVGDVPSASPSDSWDWCGLDPSVLPVTVDDIAIIVHVVDSIDGPGGYLAIGYPCVDRPTLLTQVGRVTIDGSDVAALEANGSLDALVLRAVGHAIGFGYLWPYHTPPLSSGSTQWDPVFVGQQAARQFNLNRGAFSGGWSVPIEISTDPWDWTWALPGEYPYWRESVMGSELMTPVLNPGATPLSSITIATFADMGYTVSYADADPYTVGSGSPLVGAPSHSSRLGAPPRRSRAH